MLRYLYWTTTLWPFYQWKSYWTASWIYASRAIMSVFVKDAISSFEVLLHNTSTNSRWQPVFLRHRAETKDTPSFFRASVCKGIRNVSALHWWLRTHFQTGRALEKIRDNRRIFEEACSELFMFKIAVRIQDSRLTDVSKWKWGI